MYDELASRHGQEGPYSYRLYHAFCLYKAGQLEEATNALKGVTGNEEQVRHLEALIAYAQDDTDGCRQALSELSEEDPSTVINSACVDFKEGNYERAKQGFQNATSYHGDKPELVYNLALCEFKQKQHGTALKQLAEIIERGVKEHPELGIGSYTDGMEVRSVGNTQTLQETALVEAFNLKAAIEYLMKNYNAAKEALTDIPPRQEEELDAVTLHNMALMNMESDPTDGFNKLNHLLQNPPFPDETFQNLLILYCKPQHEFYDLAADVMAENPDMVREHLDSEVHEFLDALIQSHEVPEEAYRKLDRLAGRHVEELRRLTNRIQSARLVNDSDGIRDAISAYDEALEQYIPVLMAMARIYWEREEYGTVERIFRESAEFCSEHETWKLNVAHTFFVQGNKYADAINYYLPIIEQHSDSLLSVTAVVLANLCVSYIMTQQNEEAEELMRRLEKEEERVHLQEPDTQTFHLCIVNLVIGTLYCSKGNFEFGIDRVIKSLEPYDQKLQTDTWFYAKSCFAALVDNLAKHMLYVKDETLHQVTSFLHEAERFGKSVQTRLDESAGDVVYTTVAAEARAIRSLLLQLGTF